METHVQEVNATMAGYETEHMQRSVTKPENVLQQLQITTEGVQMIHEEESRVVDPVPPFNSSTSAVSLLQL